MNRPSNTLLEFLSGIIAATAAAKNPKYAPLLDHAYVLVREELDSMTKGNAPTAHAVIEPTPNLSGSAALASEAEGI